MLRDRRQWKEFSWLKSKEMGNRPWQQQPQVVSLCEYSWQGHMKNGAKCIITAKVIAVCEHASLKLNIKVPLPFPSFVVCHDFKTMFVFHSNEHESEKFLTTMNELARAWHEFVHV